MRVRSRLLAVSFCVLGSTWAAPADALVPRQVFAVANGFVLPDFTIYEGDTLTLTNLDPGAGHDFVSSDFRPGTGNRYFESAEAKPGQSVPVNGVEYLEPYVYTFECRLHDFMKGNLTVEPAPV